MLIRWNRMLPRGITFYCYILIWLALQVVEHPSVPVLVMLSLYGRFNFCLDPL